MSFTPDAIHFAENDPELGTPRSARLMPQADVVVDGKCYQALSPWPWLKIVPSEPLQSGHAYQLAYAVGFDDEVVRPLLRCIDAAGKHHDLVVSAASEGLGVWRGLIPRGTAELWISPVAHAGPFSFVIKDFARLELSARLAYARRAPIRTFFASSARMVGLEAEAELNLRWMYGRAETQNYSEWRARRRMPASGRSAGHEPLAFVLLKGSGKLELLQRTYASLDRQTHQNWSLSVREPSVEQGTWLNAHWDRRILGPDRVAEALKEADLVAYLRPGDELVDHSLRCVSARMRQRPHEQIVYTDEAQLLPEGVTPIYKPNWSPIRQAYAPYVGRAAFIRGGDRAQTAISAASPEAWIDDFLKIAETREVGHIARALVQTMDAANIPQRPPARSSVAPGRRPKIGIVIPTRDRFDLLGPCLTSLFDKTSYPTFEVLVVDNGSVNKRTIDGLCQVEAREPRLQVRRSAGRFNFSALCNLGAQSLECEHLVFLNNDTEVLQADWLDKMLEFSRRPDVGAVGAKLLYKNRRVQHAGVVLGMGGVCGHFGAGLDRTAKGWLGGNLAPHEVSAVTAACLMVERAKFDAVGGFDATNLPVDLNDVDLCMRLAAHGWLSVCDCRTELLHLQSASRGGPMRLQKKYQGERQFFVDKWAKFIRDDPYFNPNLSLYNYEPALG